MYLAGLLMQGCSIAAAAAVASTLAAVFLFRLLL